MSTYIIQLILFFNTLEYYELKMTAVCHYKPNTIIKGTCGVLTYQASILYHHTQTACFEP